MTDAQKRELCSIVLLGCDRVTACHYLGIEPARLRRELASDPVFARQALRAAATVEMHHMRCLHQASQDPKLWRVAQWWLETCAADRYVARKAEALHAEHLNGLLDRIARTIVAEVEDEELATRLLERFEAAAEPEAFEAVGELTNANDLAEQTEIEAEDANEL